MMRKLVATCTCCWLLVLSPMIAFAQNGPEDSELAQQGQLFLQQLDNFNSQQAWQSCTKLFQALNKPQTWQNRQQALREAYGPLLERRLNRLSHRATYFISPDGHYVIIQFNSSFANKRTTNETVVLDCTQGSWCGVRDYILR